MKIGPYSHAPLGDDVTWVCIVLNVCVRISVRAESTIDHYSCVLGVILTMADSPPDHIKVAPTYNVFGRRPITSVIVTYRCVVRGLHALLILVLGKLVLETACCGCVNRRGQPSLGNIAQQSLEICLTHTL